PDASQSGDGTIFVTWDHDRYKAAEICAARITEADILAGKLVTKGSVPSVVVNRGAGKKPNI
ncbi:MAG: hypothetical protein LBC18_08675, partial [Opitutaceae bacterium]|nr:hypothetical protein [Opitutaceae bacterium]